MDNKKQIYELINQHLMTDSTPSHFMNHFVESDYCKENPFSIFLSMRSTKQSPLHHPEGNVWNHTMLVIDEAAKRKKQSHNPSIFMWAALLHDIGKPSTTKIKKGKIISYKHDIAGAELAYDFLSGFMKDTNFINQVCSLIKYHMHILFVIKDLPFSDLEGLRKNADITEVALLGLCDRLGRTNANLAEEEKNIQLFLDKLNIKKKGVRLWLRQV